ncbi:hypothetical protein CYMTET_43280 [Cymbomonas tetramitiformis]|uniref:Uncharacterized protein n=1 Tax=Cymbomonas tetramitiformis TaxID=36881 RepID=A0AAE0F0F6_9CHLO|nr:hypothetical protein CYMTET_43280 [Cymbomonas tetramitiformis]
MLYGIISGYFALQQQQQLKMRVLHGLRPPLQLLAAAEHDVVVQRYAALSGQLAGAAAQTSRGGEEIKESGDELPRREPGAEDGLDIKVTLL